MYFKIPKATMHAKHAGWLGYHLDSMQALSAGYHSVDMSTEDNNQNDHSLLS